jgi:hypothetical protein
VSKLNKHRRLAFLLLVLAAGAAIAYQFLSDGTSDATRSDASVHNPVAPLEIQSLDLDRLVSEENYVTSILNGLTLSIDIPNPSVVDHGHVD